MLLCTNCNNTKRASGGAPKKSTLRPQKKTGRLSLTQHQSMIHQHAYCWTRRWLGRVIGACCLLPNITNKKSTPRSSSLTIGIATATAHKTNKQTGESHRIESHRIASHRIASNRIASNRIASNCIESHRIASNRIELHRIESHRIASNRIELHTEASMQTNSKSPPTDSFYLGAT